jgi:hypothetical protein
MPLISPEAAGGASAPLILTRSLDEASFAEFNQLRRLHFPPERNHTPGHCTLFHKLPGAELSRDRR